MELLFEEYPRPQLKRDSYINLNGEWDYVITDSNNKEEYKDKIIVPYSPETKYSKVERVLKPNETLWYRKIVTYNEKFKNDKLILNFGAVDQICEIYINQHFVYKHIGGYNPFSIDITNFVDNNEFLLEIKVKDYTEKSELCRGKQSLNPGGIFYQSQSGIWQTVWLESVPSIYIKNVKITPDIDNEEIILNINTNIKSICKIIIDEKEHLLYTNEDTIIKIDNPILWSPENPYLYNIKIKCEKDCVESYFGMRKIEIKNIDGIPYLYLNNNKIFLNGILEQGYYKNGLYTPQEYKTFEDDIKLIKSLGFNTIRKHIKIEPYLYYYYCDKLGMLVIQDMINGGGKYNKFVIGTPLFMKLNLRDDDYKLFSRTSEFAKHVFKDELCNMINDLYNFPSIIMWTIFNEGWGQFDTKEMYDLVRNLDKTRLIDPSSGWYDKKIGNLKSDHNYFKPYNYKLDKLKRATLLSEFGGYTFGKGNKFTYGNYSNEIDYLKKIRNTILRDVSPYTQLGLIGSIYTQYNDIEDETNGIVDENRNLKSRKYSKTFKI